MSEPWISSHTIFILGHILGTALGAGGAFIGDLVFLTTIRKKILMQNELRIMALISRIIWIGVFLLVVSGIGLVWERPEIFLNSQKFWAKMTILGIIIVNGLLFHFIHFRTFINGVDKKFSTNHPVIINRTILVLSGSISALSWIYVIILGVLGRVPFSYGQIIGLYLILFFISLLSAFLLRKRLISE